MPKFTPQSSAEAKLQLMQKLAKPDDGPGGFMNDFACISSFFSDEAAPQPYFERLNTRLSQMAELDGYKEKVRKSKDKVKPTPRPPGLVAGEFQKYLGKQIGVFEDDDTNLELFYQKHHKVLSSILNGYFYNQGFNQGSGSVVSKDQRVPYADGKTPKLPGAVQPPEFRANLLRVGRHFKDPGVSPNHGDYTHQIQWYLVCEFIKDSKGLFAHRPVDIFKACGSDDWKLNNSNLCVWDYLFEGALPSRDFRHAETFNNYIIQAKDKSAPEAHSFPFLTDLIMGRYAKRKRERGEI
jgi:Family of unknown function (DUF5636)